MEGARLGKIRVLLVDDHAVLRDGLRALLALYPDIEVVGEASDGSEALDRSRELLPDVVIMDLAMPRTGGLEATRRMLNERPGSRVLVLTQHDDERYVLPALRAGAMGYVLKQMVSAELVAAIRAVHRGEPYLAPEIAKMVLNDYRRAPLQRTGDDPGLTERETEVLKHVAEGMSNQEIADLLVVSKKTVMVHRANIIAKVGTGNRTELIRRALRLGLIDLAH